jgi:catechol 2,3-dioxygenase-like lactoylglutathione lyase family enzyme
LIGTPDRSRIATVAPDPGATTCSTSRKGTTVQLTTGINHVAIMTEDLDRFVAFYTDVLEAVVVFEETNPHFRHAILAIGGVSVLHPIQPPDNPHGPASHGMFDRGHLDHLALDAPTPAALGVLRDRLVAAGASDGTVTDYGAMLSVHFVDPDGMHGEVCWLGDPSFASGHGPVPYTGDLG